MTAGRPRSFDRSEVLLKMQRVFWAHGYEATALSQLTEATGLHKPSLYAAYGDKKAIYLEAFDAYLAASGRMVGEALSHPRLADALERFFRADVDLFLAEQGQGCFLLSSAVPAAGLDPDIAKRVTTALRGLQSAFHARLMLARKLEELDDSSDIAALVDELYTTHVALSVRARAGESRTALMKTVQRIISKFA